MRRISLIPSGTRYACNAVPNTMYVEGIAGTPARLDAWIKATIMCGDAHCEYDIVKITVIEVTQRALTTYGDQEADDDKKLSQLPIKASSDKRGRISWDDANADWTKVDPDANCEYFHNCMENQGTIKPSNCGLSEDAWDFWRQISFKEWKRQEEGEWQLVNERSYWFDDEVEGNLDEDLTPSAQDHIYQIDGPGVKSKARTATDY